MSQAPTNTIPDNPWLSHAATIEAVEKEIRGVETYHLAFRDEDAAAGYRFKPGQFNMLYVPGAGEIAISLSSDPAAPGRLAHTIRRAGTATGALAKLSVGRCLGLRGPFGTSWPLEQIAGADVVMVAGGIGLAPLRPAIYRLLVERHRHGQLTLLCGARSSETLLYTQEYSHWEDQGLALQTTVDRASPTWPGNVGVVSLLLDRLPLVDPATTVILACGPEVMMRYTVASALERGIAPDQIWMSLERHMQCAVGMCGHCLLGTEFVCKDGPVFRYDRVAKLLEVEGL